MEYPYQLNSQISNYTVKLLSTYLDFPKDQPITAVDFHCREGNVLDKLTDKHEGERYLFGITNDPFSSSIAMTDHHFYKAIAADPKGEGKISKEAFSLAIIDPYIKEILRNELFDAVDQFVEPDFEARERKKLEMQERYSDQLDLAEEDLTEEEKEKRKEEFKKKLRDSVKRAKKAYRRALREQEKKLALNRDDRFLLSRATNRLMPGGILIFITPKELIDQEITLKLANNYEDIRIIRLEEDEYETYRKCIILAKKRKTNAKDKRAGFLLAETKLKPYKEIEEIEPQVEPLYKVPSQNIDAIDAFRIGPLTPEEAMQELQKSSLLSHYQKTYTQVLTSQQPTSPTPLHDGHIMLLLTSGYLNGYIGKGEDKHLVKGSATKLSRQEQEPDEDGSTVIKEKEYYHISVKYLTRDGQFHRLM